MQKNEPSPILGVYYFEDKQELLLFNKILDQYPNMAIEYVKNTKQGIKVAIQQTYSTKEEIKSFKVKIHKFLKRRNKKTSFIQNIINFFKRIIQ